MAVNNKTLHIILHVLPWEIDDCLRIAQVLKQAQYFLTDYQSIRLNIWLNLSDRYVDWDKSTIPKSHFVEKLGYIKWFCDSSKIETVFGDTDIAKNGDQMGVNHARRLGIKYPADYFLFLDPDCLFKPEHIKMLFDAAHRTATLNEMFLITISTTPREAEGFEPLTNLLFDQYKTLNNRGLTKEEIDPYQLYRWDSELREYPKTCYPQLNPVETFIFGGGWCNLFSANLIQFIGIPDFLGSYGRDDHWVLQCMRQMKKKNHDVAEWVIANALIGESYRYRQTYYQKVLTIKSKTRKELKVPEMESGLYEDTKLPLEVWQEVQKSYCKVDVAIEEFGKELKKLETI